MAGLIFIIIMVLALGIGGAFIVYGEDCLEKWVGRKMDDDERTAAAVLWPLFFVKYTIKGFQKVLK